jgi:hypothetical protein
MRQSAMRQSASTFSVEKARYSCVMFFRRFCDVFPSFFRRFCDVFVMFL